MQHRRRPHQTLLPTSRPRETEVAAAHGESAGAANPHLRRTSCVTTRWPRATPTSPHGQTGNPTTRVWAGTDSRWRSAHARWPITPDHLGAVTRRPKLMWEYAAQPTALPPPPKPTHNAACGGWFVTALARLNQSPTAAAITPQPRMRAGGAAASVPGGPRWLRVARQPGATGWPVGGDGRRRLSLADASRECCDG